MTRKKLLLGNWKMNKTPSEAKAFALGSKEMVEFAVAHGIDVGVAPTFVCLQTVKENADAKLIVAAQNCNEHDHGAFTGEISIPMLQELHIDWVILGHSERREYNGETSVACNAKIKALLAADMVPVYCCGESAARVQPKKSPKTRLPSSVAFCVNCLAKSPKRYASFMAEASNPTTLPNTCLNRTSMERLLAGHPLPWIPIKASLMGW